MKLRSAAAVVAVLAAAAQAQSSPGVSMDIRLAPVRPAASVRAGSAAHPVLELRALDKITGRASVLMAPLNEPVKFATLIIVARSCYSTPASETPETSAFLQIDEHRQDQPERRVFSGWMYASSPGLNAMQHPLYDVWAISCKTNAPGQAPSVTAAAPVKPVSPNAGANEAIPELPEDAGQ
jgi:hypothetical protein